MTATKNYLLNKNFQDTCHLLRLTNTLESDGQTSKQTDKQWTIDPYLSTCFILICTKLLLNMA